MSEELFVWIHSIKREVWRGKLKDTRNGDKLHRVWDTMWNGRVSWFYWIEVRKTEIWKLNWVWSICFVSKAHRQIEYAYNHRQLRWTRLLTHVDRIIVILHLIVFWNLKCYLLAWMKVVEWDAWSILLTLFSQSCVNIWWIMTHYSEKRKRIIWKYWSGEVKRLRFVLMTFVGWIINTIVVVFQWTSLYNSGNIFICKWQIVLAYSIKGRKKWWKYLDIDDTSEDRIKHCR